MSYFDLLVQLIPELIVTLAALAVLGVDLTVMRGQSLLGRCRTAAFLATVGCGLAGAWMALSGQTGNYHEGMLVADGLNRLVKVVLLVLTVITAWISVGSSFTEHVGEFFALLLLATVGMMFLVSTENLLMIFVALELLSLSLYILTAFDKRSVRSAEAALKYFLFGGMSAAFMLFGLSLVYGLSGAVQLSVIAARLGQGPINPMLIAGLVMIVIGFGFKVAAVPFHLWAPDAYQGAPLPSAAFIASGSKVASFYILAKVMMVGFSSAPGNAGFGQFVQGWLPVIGLVAALSVVLGNLAALAQTSVRRLLAYSAIAQAGYILIGLMANDGRGMASLIYYVATYALTILGAFCVVGLVQDETGEENFEAFTGLSKRAPLVSFCLMIFLLSLAGIPPLAGFFGKFYLFTAALAGHGTSLGLLWLVILAIAMSAVSLYYYLKVLKQVYVLKPRPEVAAMTVSFRDRFILAALAAVIVILGCAPDLLVGRLVASISAVAL